MSFTNGYTPEGWYHAYHAGRDQAVSLYDTKPVQPTTIPTLTWDEREKLAKKWAKKNGYYGKPGGWIYGPSGRPIVQGWGGLYNKLKRRIHTELGLK